MSQKISYELEFIGLPKTLRQLTEMDALLGSIGRKAGGIGGGGLGGGVQGGQGRGGTTVVSGGGGSSTTNGGLLSGVGAVESSFAAAVTVFNNAVAKFAVSILGKIGGKSSVEDEVDKVIKKKFPQGVPNPQVAGDKRPPSFGDVPPVGGWGPEGPPKQKGVHFETLFDNTKIPPRMWNDKIPPRMWNDKIPPRMWKDKISLSTLKLPIIPQQQGFFDKIMDTMKKLSGGEGGGLSELLKGVRAGMPGSQMSGLNRFIGLIGGISKNFGFLSVATVAIAGAMIALRVSIKLLTEGIQHGAEAYKTAARYGMGVGRTFAITSAFKSIGMETPDLGMLQGQFNPKASKYNVGGDAGVVLGAARAGQFGNVQELTNMSKEFESAMKDAAHDAQIMEKASKATMMLNMDTVAISREWKTFLSQSVSEFYPLIHGLFKSVELLIQSLHGIIKLIQNATPGGAALNFISSIFTPRGGEEGFTRLLGGPANSPSANSWEKMGFVMNGPKNDINKEIARNTRETTATLKGIFNILSHGLLNMSSIPSYAP